MMAPNMSFSPVRVIFCLAVPRMTARMMPENTTIPTISRREDPDPEALAVHALDNDKIEPRTRVAQ